MFRCNTVYPIRHGDVQAYFAKGYHPSKWHTPKKINSIAPENSPLEKEIPIGNHHSLRGSTPPKFNIAPKKMDGWKITFLLGPIFRGEMLDFQIFQGVSPLTIQAKQLPHLPSLKTPSCPCFGRSEASKALRSVWDLQGFFEGKATNMGVRQQQKPFPYE